MGTEDGGRRTVDGGRTPVATWLTSEITRSSPQTPLVRTQNPTSTLHSSTSMSLGDILYVDFLQESRLGTDGMLCDDGRGRVYVVNFFCAILIDSSVVPPVSFLKNENSFCTFPETCAYGLWDLTRSRGIAFAPPPPPGV